MVAPPLTFIADSAVRASTKPFVVAVIARRASGVSSTNKPDAAAMADARGMLRKELAEDGLHPNRAGYAIMAPLAERAVEKALAGG